jgi:hypothetical protein
MGVLLAILLVQALPQVNLLDTAFHRNTAPVVVHSQATAAPIWASAGVTINRTCKQCLGTWHPASPFFSNRTDFTSVPDLALRC